MFQILLHHQLIQNMLLLNTGDTLSQIALKYHTSYEYLAQINGISNPNLIFVGQKIYIPSLESNELHDTSHNLYIVQCGNTLTQISNLFDVSIDEIVTLNNIQNPNLIFAGSTLRIPTIN